jgi:hypothetical protein
MRLAASRARKIQAAVCAGEALVCLRLGAAMGHPHSVNRLARTSAADPSSGANHQPASASGPDLAALTYELLDAHSDTAQLADGLEVDRYWAAHLDYLRALQRKGRETLAHSAPGWVNVR